MNTRAVILNHLNQLENSLKCPICNDKCVEPLRIKICGHYFCAQCLQSQKKDHNCPKCNEFYESCHVDYNNIAIECEKQLKELRQLLESQENYHNTMTYNHNQYQVIFISACQKTNAKGETSLHLACKRKNLEQVRELVECPDDINARDYAGWAPLHEAIYTENLEIIEYLLKQHCLVNIPALYFETPLHQAVSLNNIEIVKLLLKYGADVTLKDYSGKTPIENTTDENIKELLRLSSDSAKTPKLFNVFLPFKVSVYCHSIDEHAKQKLKNCKDIQIQDKTDNKKPPDYLIIKKTHKLSFKILQAMLEGIQFLTQDRVDEFITGNRYINIPEETFVNNTELNRGIRKACMSALLKLPQLFEGLNFYIEDHTSPVEVYNLKVDKEYLKKLVKCGKGKVLCRPPATRTCEANTTHPFFAPKEASTFNCCNYIIYNENHPPNLLYKMPELQHRSSKWLIDCVIGYEISD
ncbi:BRCA1-associated RING domain protein 1-like [Euwallacea similis]|uniref:BRCA1-associated RING domain protein 1-like n=1 Tax=Euwallacea similis TaxID=1736056 RepID=UPI00344D031D